MSRHSPIPPPMRRVPSRTRLAVACATAATAALLAGCGGDSAESASSSEDRTATASSSPHSGHSGDMDGMDGAAMGDPSATPANRLPDAELVEATLEPLDTRPPGMDDVAGTAWLAQSTEGTTVTVSLTGLEPGEAYMAHLHERSCSTDNGGDHFQFEKGGATTPPNEVHLMFTADESGAATTTVNNARRTGDDAVALVVHPHAAMDNRLACADFEF